MTAPIRTLVLSVTAIATLATAAAAVPRDGVAANGHAMHDDAMHRTMMEDPAMQAECHMPAGTGMGMMEPRSERHTTHHAAGGG